MIRLIAFALLLLCWPIQAFAQAFSFADIPFLGQGAPAPYVFSPVSTKLEDPGYMYRGAGLTGASDSKQGIVSFWYKADADDDDERTLFIGNYPAGGFSQAGVHIYRQLDQSIFIDLYNSAGTRIMGIEAPNFNVAAGWQHLVCSWDLSTETCNLYVNGIEGSPAFEMNDDTIDYTQPNWFVGCKTDTTDFTDACVSEFYLNFGEFIDLTDIDNRHKFYNAGEPVDMGADGSIPTGTVPEVYFQTWTGVNSGSGGNFTLSAGLTACDTPQGPVPPTPDILWLKCNDGSGTTVTATVGPNHTWNGNWTTGVAGSALDNFGGDAFYGQSSSPIAYGTNVITFASWVTINDTITRVMIESSANGNTTDGAFFIFTDGGNLIVSMNNGGADYYTFAAPTVQVWVHLLVVLDCSTTSATPKVYYDGVAQTCTGGGGSRTTTINYTTQTFNIGARNGESYFYRRYLDDIRIYTGDKSADVPAIMADPQ